MGYDSRSLLEHVQCTIYPFNYLPVGQGLCKFLLLPDVLGRECGCPELTDLHLVAISVLCSLTDLKI